MNDWKEIALDDILYEVDKVAEEGKEEFESEEEFECEQEFEDEPQNENKPQDERGTPDVVKYVPFCCVTTIPEGFDLVEASKKVAWHKCLNLRQKRERITVKACEGEQECGRVPVCVTKVSGCIQFIASAKVLGDRRRSSEEDCEGDKGRGRSESHICCKGCVCVDECVRCRLARPRSCPRRLGIVKVGVEDLEVCVEPCEPCDGCTDCTPTSQVVTFSGKFKIKYWRP